jgi:hypothetical protein
MDAFGAKEKNTENIIAIYGKSNSGKTSTIKEISRLLCQKYHYNPETVAAKGDDIYQVLKKDSFIIGIISQGDVGSWVEEYLAELIKRKCVLIICATRTRGKTCDAVKKYNGKRKIAWEKIEYSSKTPLSSIKKNTVGKILKIIGDLNLI